MIEQKAQALIDEVSHNRLASDSFKEQFIQVVKKIVEKETPVSLQGALLSKAQEIWDGKKKRQEIDLQKWTFDQVIDALHQEVKHLYENLSLLEFELTKNQEGFVKH